jgi:DNA polymerase III alpha subunit (gram-positive type)
MDSETAETPKIDGQLDVGNGQVYDLGLMVIDDEGKIYEKISLINEDVFFRMPQSMQEAYFANKIPQYLEDMRMGKHKIVNSWQMYQIFHELCRKYNISAVVAHNAYFDIKALNATMRYQTKSRCRWFLPWGMEVIDTLKLARNTFAKDPQYVTFCKENGYMTNHEKPRPRLTAEILYKYITGCYEFEESHTGLKDVEIEAQIFMKMKQRGEK